MLGTGPRAAARQAAVLFALAGLLALVGMVDDAGHAADLIAIAVGDFAVVAAALWLPWERTRPATPAVLGLAGFVILGLSTWSFGGFAAGTGPFLVLLYAWAALHLSRAILLAFAAPATLAYLLPLVLTGQPPMVIGSAVVLMPVAVAVALLIEAQARHLRDDRERLARIEQWRAAMINTLAHDVRSPLATVTFALEETREQALEETRERAQEETRERAQEETREHVRGEPREDATGHTVRMLDAALRQTARISRLAEGLLDVQRIDSAGHLRLDRQVLSASDLVRGSLAYLPRTDDITVDIDEDLRIDVDRQRFEQIVVNLVGNALRYGRPPVVVRITRDGGQDRLEVRDHGPGIPESLRPALFGQFAVGGPDGVGLGLWIVRQLAAAHGGNACAEPRDPGVAMVVTFPSPATE